MLFGDEGLVSQQTQVHALLSSALPGSAIGQQPAD
jgi:hypothetical protein